MPPPRPNTHPRFQLFTPITPRQCPQSTLKPKRWRALLEGYPDRDFPKILENIARYGARVGYEGPHIRIRGRNHSSAYRISDEISDNIASEVTAGRLIPITETSLPPAFFISPLGAVEKKANGQRTGWRRIHDLSFPHSSSVNDGIPKHYGTLQYQTLDDAIKLITSAGRYSKLRKHDLEDAFRMIPVSPYDYWLFVFEWNNTLYVDIFLPFGLRTSPFIFNLFAEGLHWILEHVFHRQLVHYLDDFLLVNDPDPEFFGQLASYLGFYEKVSKRADGYQADFLGIELDTDAMQARLPPDKQARALAAVQSLLQLDRVTHCTLERLLGFLSFCTRVLPLGRPFLRNLFTFLNRLSHIHPHATARINAAAKRDLQWWSTFLPCWSGIQMISAAPRKHIHLYTDASGVKGIGGWFSSNAFSARVPRSHRGRHIDWKEAYAIVFAFAQWSALWHNCLVEIHCDNQTIVSAIKSQSIRGPAIDLLQALFLVTTLDNIKIQATWLSSQDNWIADALSRFEFSKIANIFPQFLDPFNRRRHSGSPMSALKARLRNSFGTLSPPLPEHNTKQVLLVTNNSQPCTATPPSRPPSYLSRTG